MSQSNTGTVVGGISSIVYNTYQIVTGAVANLINGGATGNVSAQPAQTGQTGQTGQPALKLDNEQEKPPKTSEKDIPASSKSTSKNCPMVQVIQNDNNGKNNNNNNKNKNESSNIIITILEYIISFFNLNKSNLRNFDLNNLFILLIVYYVIFVFSKNFIKGIVTTVIYTAIITYTIIRVYNYIYTIS